MEGDFIKINSWLLPFSWLYGCGVKLRNFLFDVGILKSRSFKTPIISVGNLTVGGTGKTPHTEYLVELLKQQLNVAVLSRGYKRKSKGFLIANEHTTARDIGDEPFQMKRKYPNITVAVDKDRVHGIEMLTKQRKDIDVILLDDAFQHRFVKPGVNILLVDYHRLIIYDKLMPAGRLREPQSGKNRADIVIVTKCPKALKPMEFRVITKAMSLFPYQTLFFTKLAYEDMHPLFGNDHKRSIEDIKPDEHVMLLTGIASPRQLIEDLTPYTSNLTPLSFSDHHDFKQKDVQQINDTFAALPAPKFIITTEKDAARLLETEGLSDEVRKHIYYLPVKIEFMLDQQNSFNENILGYVRKNSRDSILAKTKDDHKPENGNSSGDRPRTISFRNN
ncbi:MAG: tetraacyldisaccharide 4'-kinase [Prevotella sp.]|nr:tetraacyldisaccharide 4'-kinase [Prevotella sp.]